MCVWLCRFGCWVFSGVLHAFHLQQTLPSFCALSLEKSSGVARCLDAVVSVQVQTAKRRASAVSQRRRRNRRKETSWQLASSVLALWAFSSSLLLHQLKGKRRERRAEEISTLPMSSGVCSRFLLLLLHKASREIPPRGGRCPLSGLSLFCQRWMAGLCSFLTPCS